MNKKELKYQQKYQKLVEKISNMSTNDYNKMQINLDINAHYLFGLNLIFFGLSAVFGVGTIFTIGTSLLPIFIGVALTSILGICAITTLTRFITNRAKRNSEIKASLISMEEIEEKQKEQTKEIINKIKKEKSVEILVEQKPEREDDLII